MPLPEHSHLDYSNHYLKSFHRTSRYVPALLTTLGLTRFMRFIRSEIESVLVAFIQSECWHYIVWDMSGPVGWWVVVMLYKDPAVSLCRHHRPRPVLLQLLKYFWNSNLQQGGSSELDFTLRSIPLPQKNKAEKSSWCFSLSAWYDLHIRNVICCHCN